MTCYVAGLVVTALIVVACSAGAWAQTTFPSQIGVEVADRPTGFIDAFKDQGRLFLNSSGNPVPADANGNPLSDGTAVIFDNRPVPEWLGYSDDPATYQPNCAGTYTTSFQGQAVLSNVAGAPVLTFANQSYNAATNTTTVSVTLPGGATYADGPALMEINFTNTQLTPTSGTNTGIANLQAIRPGFTLAQAANPTQAFDPAFVNAFAPFGYMRFMAWLGTNTSPGYYGEHRREPGSRVSDTQWPGANLHRLTSLCDGNDSSGRTSRERDLQRVNHPANNSRKLLRIRGGQ